MTDVDSTINRCPDPPMVFIETTGIARSVRLSVPWRSCLGIGTLAACSLATAGHQRCADCGPVRGRTQIRRDFCHRRTAIGGGHIVSPPPGRYLVSCCNIERVDPVVEGMVPRQTILYARMVRILLGPFAGSYIGCS